MRSSVVFFHNQRKEAGFRHFQKLGDRHSVALYSPLTIDIAVLQQIGNKPSSDRLEKVKERYSRMVKDEGGVLVWESESTLEVIGPDFAWLGVMVRLGHPVRSIARIDQIKLQPGDRFIMPVDQEADDALQKLAISLEWLTPDQEQTVWTSLFKPDINYRLTSVEKWILQQEEEIGDTPGSAGGLRQYFRVLYSIPSHLLEATSREIRSMKFWIRNIAVSLAALAILALLNMAIDLWSGLSAPLAGGAMGKNIGWIMPDDLSSRIEKESWLIIREFLDCEEDAATRARAKCQFNTVRYSSISLDEAVKEEVLARLLEERGEENALAASTDTVKAQAISGSPQSFSAIVVKAWLSDEALRFPHGEGSVHESVLAKVGNALETGAFDAYLDSSTASALGDKNTTLLNFLFCNHELEARKKLESLDFSCDNINSSPEIPVLLYDFASLLRSYNPSTGEE